LSPTQDSIANQLLRRLSPRDFDLLAPHLSALDLPLRRPLETHNRRVEHVYFLESGIASVVISAGEECRIEVGVIGHEGMTGIAVILRSGKSLHDIFMQSAGAGWQIPAKDLRAAMAQSDSLCAVLLNYAHTMVSQMAYTALANGRYRVDERLARWLLMANDRTQDDRLSLTHEFLSVMLGTRRASVTVVLNEFEKRGLIRTGRGEIEITDRPALLKAANGSYGGPEAEYERLLGGPVLGLS
jgi:CRP-like cAMP-binding protein